MLASMVYPDWKVRFYVDLLVPSTILMQLEEHGVEVIQKNEIGDWSNGLFWRFEAIDDDFDAVIFRDTDSRLDEREAAAVKMWIESDKGCHILKDHPYHVAAPIMGGAFGLKKGVVPNMCDLIKNFTKQNQYGTDYLFLQTKIWPLVANNVMIHGEILSGLPFPIERKGLRFFGQVFDENENTVEEHLIALQDFLCSK